MKKNKLLKNKIRDTLPVLYLETFMLMILGQFLGGFILGIPVGIAAVKNPAIMQSAFLNTVLLYAVDIGLWAVILFWITIWKRNRPIFAGVGSRPLGNNWKYALLGLLLGFVANSVCVLTAWLHNDIALTYDAVRPLWFFTVFLMVFVQSSAEELLCRGFLYQKLRRSYKNPAVAIVGNSLLFSILHLFNEGITVLAVLNIFITGVWFSLMVYYMDSLWCAFAAHTAWNFTQNILFGLPNSGINVPYSVFKLNVSTARNSFAYNVGFGIEGTIMADIVLLIACVMLYLWGRRHGKKSIDVWNS